jgi:TM2 domain-containing membrane protein YozV
MSTRGFRALVPCFLAWLVPGAGHLYLGKRGRAAIFFLVVVAMFVLGLVSDGRSYLIDREQPLTYLATFANIATGPLEMFSRRATYDRLVYRMPGPENDPESVQLLASMRRKVSKVTNEYGTTYLLTAGLMNLLLILDAFDIAIGRKV